jgi:hypothetical protein
MLGWLLVCLVICLLTVYHAVTPELIYVLMFGVGFLTTVSIIYFPLTVMIFVMRYYQDSNDKKYQYKNYQFSNIHIKFFKITKLCIILHLLIYNSKNYILLIR